MQVTSCPRQQDEYNCGLWAALFVEVFCTHAEGRFRVHTVDNTQQLLCEGSDSDFLMNPQVWPTTEDVNLLRTFTHAATLAYFKTSFMSCGPLLEEKWIAAQTRLKAQFPTLQYTDGQLWCETHLTCTAECTV